MTYFSVDWSCCGTATRDVPANGGGTVETLAGRPEHRKKSVERLLVGCDILAHIHSSLH
jgi:hypothetical protein